jgi:hypothetical protein
LTVNRLGLSLAALALATAQIGAQSIRGIVLQPDSATRAGGVIVAAADAAGNVVARALSGEEGSFDLRLPAAGVYTIRLLRVGYRPTVMANLDVPAAGRSDVRFVLGAEAVQLSAVTVRSDNVCGSTEDVGRVVAQLWEEARTALTATELSIGAGTLNVQWQSFMYSMDRGGSRATETMVMPRNGFTERPFVSIGADSLARNGYVVRDRGDLVYHAPDAPALLSDKFAATHCFRVEPLSRSRPHWIGISFRPTPERDRLGEITGTLWLDRATSELRLLEFRYTNQMPEADTPLVGGFVEFVRVASGHWFISRWAIRTPRMVQRTVGGSGIPGGGADNRMVLATVTVTGGELLSVRRRTDLLYDADRSSITVEGVSRVSSSQPSACGAGFPGGLTVGGTVANLAKPAPGAVVRVAWTGADQRPVMLSSIADARGEFRIPCVTRAAPITVSASLGDQRAEPMKITETAKAELVIDIDFGPVAARRP